ncbi:hypothetical protein HanPI659440_Chr13g0498201 [Helianthus annuus]|nr:hypothetical protein HanPI659440_Chr13g0498201 [Helianthus annuus]
MGGGGDHGHGDFRTKVWTMTGGPNCRPLHWKRNTAIAMAGIFLVCIPIAMKSAELESNCCWILMFMWSVNNLKLDARMLMI